MKADKTLKLWNLLWPDKPLQLGLKVKVSSTNEYSSDWQGDFVITGIQTDEHYGINITISDSLDPKYGCDHSDGWTIDDLIPV